MSDCEVCGPNKSFEWRPIVRVEPSDDFMDLTELEHDHSSGLIMWMFDSKYTNGQDVSSLPFLVWAEEALNNDEYQMADQYLRFAANRDNWLAMMMLAELRAENFEMFDEAWRWASRVVYLLSDARNNFEEYLEDTSREKILSDARALIEELELRGADATQITPSDVGVNRDRQYCLEHGILVVTGTPIGKCGDDVHLVSRNFS